jgi:hypothetical protein
MFSPHSLSLLHSPQLHRCFRAPAAAAAAAARRATRDARRPTPDARRRSRNERCVSVSGAAAPVSMLCESVLCRGGYASLRECSTRRAVGSVWRGGGGRTAGAAASSASSRLDDAAAASYRAEAVLLCNTLACSCSPQPTLGVRIVLSHCAPPLTNTQMSCCLRTTRKKLQPKNIEMWDGGAGARQSQTITIINSNNNNTPLMEDPFRARINTPPPAP